MAICSKCNGKKIIELRAGLIVKRCPECGGTGAVDVGPADSGNKKAYTGKPRGRKKKNG